MSIKKKIRTFNQLIWNLAAQNKFTGTRLSLYKDGYKNEFENPQRLTQVSEESADIKKIVSIAKDCTSDLNHGIYSEAVKHYINSFVSFNSTNIIISRKRKQEHIKRVTDCTCKSCNTQISRDLINSTGSNYIGLKQNIACIEYNLFKMQSDVENKQKELEKYAIEIPIAAERSIEQNEMFDNILSEINILTEYMDLKTPEYLDKLSMFRIRLEECKTVICPTCKNRVSIYIPIDFKMKKKPVDEKIDSDFDFSSEPLPEQLDEIEVIEGEDDDFSTEIDMDF